jgi:TolB protein
MRLNRQVALAATMRFSRVFPLVAVAALLAACGDDANGPSDDSPTANVAPTAAFTVQCDGLDCSFTNSSEDSDGTIDAYGWDFGDSSAQVTTRHAAHTFAGPGAGFTVTLIVTDDDGETGTASELVYVSRGVLVSPSSLIQHVTPNRPVSVPPTVSLSDQYGRAMPGVAVDFQVTGGGSIGNTHAVSDEDGRASAGQWIVGAADGADRVTARIDGVVRATFYARAAAVRARYDLETVGGRPVPGAQGLFFWSDGTVTHRLDSTRVTAVYRRNGAVLTWMSGSCCEVTATIQGDRITVVEFLEEDEVYLRNYGTLNPPELPPDPAWIYIADSDGSNSRLLVSGARPAWSPDGRRIAFQRDGNIHVISTDGTGETMLSEGREPAWAPDGTRLAFTGSEGIAVMRDDGSDLRTLVRHDLRDDTYIDDMGVGKPAWSPDGASIAFEHRGDGDMVPAQIFVMNADGSDPRRVTPTQGPQSAESDPAWSPNGSEIVFWSYGYGIAAATLVGGVPRRIYQNFPAVAYGAKPVWSPEGSTILFTANLFSLEERAIWTVASGGGVAGVLIEGGADPAWSPDGGKIAFERDEGAPR